MADMLSIDMKKVHAATEHLKDHPPSQDDVAKDPAAFLAGIGVHLDDKTASILKNKLAAKASGAQAGSIHVDLMPPI